MGSGGWSGVADPDFAGSAGSACRAGVGDLESTVGTDVPGGGAPLTS